MAAAAGVFGTGSAWPDLAVAGILATLAVAGGVQILRHARDDLRATYDAGAGPRHGFIGAR